MSPDVEVPGGVESVGHALHLGHACGGITLAIDASLAGALVLGMTNSEVVLADNAAAFRNAMQVEGAEQRWNLGAVAGRQAKLTNR